MAWLADFEASAIGINAAAQIILGTYGLLHMIHNLARRHSSTLRGPATCWSDEGRDQP